MSTAMPTTPSWNWRVPGVQVNPPHVWDPLVRPRSWSQLTFDPLSAYDLRRHLGARTDEEGQFKASIDRFLASDIAWLAAGASTDGRHGVAANQFFTEFDELRDSTVTGRSGSGDRKEFIENARKLLFDLATKIDRAIGGTTMVLSMEGTVMPGTPERSEYLKANVYMPPSFIAENPGAEPQIAAIVQLFIEHVGVRTVAAWTRRAEARWPLTQTGRKPIPSSPTIPLVPAPLPNSARYVFPGRVAGWRPAALAHFPPPSAVHVPAPSVAIVYDIDELTRDDLSLDLTAAYERIVELERNLTDSDRQVDILQGVALDYERLQADLKAQITSLEAETTRLKRESAQLRSARDFPGVPSSPSRQRASAHTIPSTPSRPRVTPASMTPSTLSGTTSTTPSGRLRSSHATPPPYSATAPRGQLSRESARLSLGPATQQFLIDEGLGAHADAIRLICRLFSPLKWSSEIDGLQCFPDAVKGALIQALEQDVTI
ncbi:hypothetical protein B0H14DRAFT_3012347 [Mycena olivaceomarginata]|nr:hypothetical protein B0H14DRAFT_3012347 [Mycena olivaceomarginata]